MKTITKEFNYNSPYWSNDLIDNLYFLQHHRDFIDSIYRRRGYVFLSDIYALIGLPVTKESCLLGWHKDSKYTGSFTFIPISETNNYELVFECYPIIEYFDKEEK